MKKFVLVAVLSCCAALLQAVTVNWASIGSGATGSISVSHTSDGTTYAAIVTGGSIPASGSYQTFLMIKNSNNNNQLRLRIDENGKFCYETREKGTWKATVQITEFSALTYAPNEEVAVAFTLNTDTITFYIGNLAATIDNPFSGITFTNVLYGREPSGGLSFGGDIKVYSTTDVVTGADVYALVNPAVPEPTALALLALGVAGIALRRRTA